MPRDDVAPGPDDTQAERDRELVRSYLLVHLTYAHRGLAKARASYRLDPSDQHRGMRDYWATCIKCINWLLTACQ